MTAAASRAWAPSEPAPVVAASASWEAGLMPALAPSAPAWCRPWRHRRGRRSRRRGKHRRRLGCRCDRGLRFRLGLRRGALLCLLGFGLFGRPLRLLQPLFLARRGGAFRLLLFRFLRLPLFRFRHDRSPDRVHPKASQNSHPAPGGNNDTALVTLTSHPSHSAGMTARQFRQRLRHRTAGRPVDQLDGVDGRNGGAGTDLRQATDIAGRNHIRL